MEFGGAGPGETEAVLHGEAHVDLVRIKPGPPSSGEHSGGVWNIGGFIDEEVIFCLRHPCRIPPRRLNLALAQRYSPGSPSLTFYIKENVKFVSVYKPGSGKGPAKARSGRPAFSVIFFRGRHWRREGAHILAAQN